MKFILYIELIFFGIFITSCTESNQAGKNNEDNKEHFSYDTTSKSISIDTLSICDFNVEHLYNGIAKAYKKATLTFNAPSIIDSIYVKNSQHVKKEYLLCKVDDRQAILDFELAKARLDKANLQLEDLILGLGHKISDSITLPPALLNIAKIKSGYKDAQLELKKAKLALSNCTVLSPFSGIVANLTAQINNPTTNYKTFCDIINDSLLEIEFEVMESELAQLKIATNIIMNPFSDSLNTLVGTVVYINPSVNEHGLVKVSAQVVNEKHLLLDGMNVKVRTLKVIPNVIKVPKEAIILRKDKKIVFTLQEGKAIWNEVETGYENENYIEITKGLKAGMLIIKSGNVNLSHGSLVKVRN